MRLQVTAFKPPTGNGPFKVTLSDGNEYRSFDADVYGGIAVGQWGEAASTTKSRVYNNKTYQDLMLTSWKPEAAPAGSVDAPTPTNSTVPPEVWEAKDRTLAMQSALSSAAQYMQALAVAKPELINVQNWIAAGREAYKLVQRARLGLDLRSDEKALHEAQAKSATANQAADTEGLPF